MSRHSVWALAVGFCCWLSACETTPPEILSVQWQLNFVHNVIDGSTEEHLSFFVSVADEDGVKDINALYLLNDETEQFWKLEPANWVAYPRDNEYWLGSSDLVMPDRSPIPRGTYRVLLFDEAGERAQKTWNLHTVLLSSQKIQFPSIQAKEGVVTLHTALPNVQMVLYDRNFFFMDFALLEYDSFPVEQLPRYRELTRARGVQLYLYAWVADKGYGIFSGPFVGLYDDAVQKQP